MCEATNQTEAAAATFASVRQELLNKIQSATERSLHEGRDYAYVARTLTETLDTLGRAELTIKFNSTGK